MEQSIQKRVSNADIAELLAREAERRDGILQRAFRRAARSAFLWPEQATDIFHAGRPLTELKSIGPFMAKELQIWLKTPRLKVPPAPMIRRNFLTLADARILLAKKARQLPKLQGDLQMHTQWSDGSGRISDMAAAAAERGYHYIAITDHSKGLKIAGGINERDLARQGAEINKVNQSIARNGGEIAVLRSIEMNLNPRGEGDMDPAALRQLDLVLGSFHSALRTREDQTERYLRALGNPDIQILGHPRGRIYNYRLGLKADWERVFAEASRLDKAVEIDAYPDRQDIDVRLLKIARRSGTRISIGTDAHHPWQLDFIDLALAAVLLAKIPFERVINFMSLSQLRTWVAGMREREDRRTKPRSPKLAVKRGSPEEATS